MPTCLPLEPQCACAFTKASNHQQAPSCSGRSAASTAHTFPRRLRLQVPGADPSHNILCKHLICSCVSIHITRLEASAIPNTRPKRAHNTAFTLQRSLASEGACFAARRPEHCRLQHPCSHIHGKQLLAQIGTGLCEARHRPCVAQAVAGLCCLALPLLQLLQGGVPGQGRSDVKGGALAVGGRPSHAVTREVRRA